MTGRSPGIRRPLVGSRRLPVVDRPRPAGGVGADEADPERRIIRSRPPVSLDLPDHGPTAHRTGGLPSRSRVPAVELFEGRAQFGIQQGPRDLFTQSGVSPLGGLRP